jgi:hypothetical protein
MAFCVARGRPLSGLPVYNTVGSNGGVTDGDGRFDFNVPHGTVF